MYENFIRPRVSKENLDSSIETNNDKSCDDDDDYEDNGFNLGERHATDPNAKDLNVNPSKKIKRERRKSKENVKNSKDLEEIEIIKEFHEEIKAKQKYKEQSEFDCETLFRSTFATELKYLVRILRHRAKHEMSSSNIRWKILLIMLLILTLINTKMSRTSSIRTSLIPCITLLIVLQRNTKALFQVPFLKIKLLI